MADYNSSLPVRTETAGDVIIKIADSLVPSQQAQVTSARELSVLSTAQPGVDIGDVTINNGSGGAAVNIQDGGNSITVDGSVSINGPVTVTATDLDIRDLVFATDKVDVSGSTVVVTDGGGSITVDGTVAATQSGSWSVTVNNASGASAVNIQDGGNSITVDGTITANQGTANATPWNENIAQIAGSAPSASNSLPVQLTSGTAFISASNPLAVSIVDPPASSTQVNDYKQAASIAVGSSDNHDYTVTSGKTLKLEQIIASGSGKAKLEVAVETGVASGTFTTRFVQFNSTAETNMQITLSSPISVAAGVRVRVIMTNRDTLAQDLYSTICGYES